MKKVLPSLTALFVLCSSWCAPAFATTSPQGSTVMVPPLITKGAVERKQSVRTVQLPTQAGKVSKMVTTNLLSKGGTSWIAKGNKHYSLCAPARGAVACAPIVAASIMQDIEVGALAGPKGEPLLTFAPSTKISPKRFIRAVGYFLVRTGKQVAHFERMASVHASRPGGLLQAGVKSALYDVGGGSSGTCSYDDDGSYECTGGSDDVGNDSGGDNGSGYDSGGYPSGNDNGDCTDASGNACPVVVITGQRPDPVDPMSLFPCKLIGLFLVCDISPPPIVGGEPQEPHGQVPWMSQSWCNFWGPLCSAGQIPEDNDRGGNSSTSGLSLGELINICYDIWDVEMDVCSAHRSGMDSRMFEVCKEKANNRREACRDTARALTDNGAHAAP